MKKIYVENIKCGGCVHTITEALMKIEGVESVIVDDAKQAIGFLGPANVDIVAAKLASLGYPEIGHNNLKHKAVSFVSCAIGKLSN